MTVTILYHVTNHEVLFGSLQKRINHFSCSDFWNCYFHVEDKEMKWNVGAGNITSLFIMYVKKLEKVVWRECDVYGIS